MIAILEKYLHKNNYFHLAKADVKLQLLSHPDYPSLKAITDTLDYFGVANIAINAPKEALDQLPVSFLALLNTQQSDSGVMATKKKNKIALHFEDGHRKILSEHEFKEIWTGDTVVIEEALYKEKSINYGSGVLVFLLVSVFAMLQAVSFSWPSFILSLLSLAGLYLSYLTERSRPTRISPNSRSKRAGSPRARRVSTADSVTTRAASTAEYGR